MPDKKNIKHEGFLIVCLAQIYSALSSLDKVDLSIWKQLLDKTNNINNVADRVVVLATVGSCSKNKGVFSDGIWLDDVKAQVSKIPSLMDRMERLKWVAQIIEQNNKTECKTLLSEAMKLSNNLEDPDDAIDNRRKILDYAHGIEPALAKTLIGLLDDDEARAPAKEALKDRVNHLQLVKNVAEDPAKVDISKGNYQELVDISMSNLGSLNANRIPPRRLEDFKSLAEMSANLPLSDAIHIWRWILTNYIRKSSNASDMRELHSIFQAISLSADLVLALIGKRSHIYNIKSMSNTSGLILGPGDREKYYEFIQNWLEKNQPKQIRISDPFLGPDDLYLVKVISNISSSFEIEVLTSRKHCKAEGGVSIDEAFQLSWDSISDVPAPNTNINVVSIGDTGEHPIHDRWILIENCGLRLGTSSNSIGVNKISEISELSDELWSTASAKFDQILSREMKSVNEKRILITSFAL